MAQLRQLADELRTETIDAVSITGGHLGAGLGVVELTVAIHHLFDTPTDRVILGLVTAGAGNGPCRGRVSVTVLAQVLAPNPSPASLYSSRGGLKISSTVAPVAPVRMPCDTPPGVCQKSPAVQISDSPP